MSTDEKNIKSKPGRKLTEFLCRELLFDFATGRLDSERTLAVENFLKTKDKLKEDFYKLKGAMAYCDELSNTKVSESFVNEVLVTKPLFQKINENVSKKKFPDFVKWGSEAFLISIGVAAIAIFVPWTSWLDWLPEVPKVVSEPIINVPKPPSLDGAELAESEDENLEEPVASNIDNVSEVLSPTNLQSSINTADSNSEAVDAEELAGDESTELAEENESTDSKESKIEVGSNKKAEAKKTKLVGSKKALKGELYRAFMTLGDLDIITPEIAGKIKSFGGERAGKVKLGWRKTDGSYFHMSINRSHFDEFQAYLEKFGPVRIVKDPHWRVMPDDKIRLILWVEDKDLKKNDSN